MKVVTYHFNSLRETISLDEVLNVRLDNNYDGKGYTPARILVTEFEFEGEIDDPTEPMIKGFIVSETGDPRYNIGDLVTISVQDVE